MRECALVLAPRLYALPSSLIACWKGLRRPRNRVERKASQEARVENRSERHAAFKA